MAGLKYYAIKGDPVTMSGAELLAQMHGADDAKVVRSLLMREIERVRAGDQKVQRTMRNVWYQRIKPVLTKLGVLNKQTRGGGDVDWPQKMSNYLGELVDAGVTSYGDLMIVDASRARRNPSDVRLMVANVTVVRAHYPNVILFTEKDTIYSLVDDLASIYGLSALSGGGQPSKAATEDLVRRIASHPKFCSGSKIYVLSLTDYDPAGYLIADAVAKQVELSAGLFPQVGGVVHHRLGIVPAQMSPNAAIANRYEPKDKGLDEWFALTGGVDGEPFGLELDALDLDDLRRLFIDGIEKVIDGERRYHADLAAALVDRLIWDALQTKFDAMRAELYAAIDGDELTATMTASADADIIRRFALDGFSSIDPVVYDRYVFNAVPDVRERISNAMVEKG